MKCPFCGTDNVPGDSFCSNCGGYLDSSAPSSVSSGGTSNTATIVSTGPTTGGGLASSGSLIPNAKLQNGRYVVEQVLGSGGMGTAVLAKDTRVSNKRVVIKELVSDSKDPVQFQEDVRNFEREVDTLANLDHPLIPTVTDSFQEGTRYFMVQEYAPGENLETHIDRLGKAMPEREVLTYAVQVLDILDYLGQQTPPIVHRDIKPANIIIGSKDKRAHLVDFGIARADAAKNAKKQTAALGTPGYAPPEQYQGKADARSDLYALAATMHHLLTNRDPRNYGPFSYPLARSVNPQVSPETEQLLTKALTIDPFKRFQSAAEMRQRIEQILRDRFNMTPDTSMYMFSTSGSMTMPAVSTTPAPATPPPPPVQNRGQQQGAQPMFPPPRAVPPPPRRRSGSGLGRGLAILVGVVVLILLVIFITPFLFKGSSPNTSTNSPAASPVATQTAEVKSNGIGVQQINNELIGLSDGTVAFDTNRPDGNLKVEAAQKLKDGDSSTSQSLLHSALAQDTTDAEALIYLENQHVMNSGSPYVTLVIGATLTGQNKDVVQAGRDALQGAYVAQKEFNANNGAKLNGTLVRVLIANAGSSSTNVAQAARQIVQFSQTDKSLVGVMGWPYSGYAQNAIGVLSAAKIPMLSSTASSDDLTGASPYFFRVAPPDSVQGQVGAQYALNKLQAKNVAVFEDQSDAYSRSLADAFTQAYQKLNGNVMGPYQYTKGDQASVTSQLQNLANESTVPDVIYFSGYSGDVALLMNQVAANSKFANTKILGGDALYNLGGYSNSSSRAGFDRLRFTAFAYPDEWEVLGYGKQKPGFFSEYSAIFDPHQQHKGAYGFSRPSYNVMLGYDATLTLIKAAGNVVSAGKKTFSGDDIRQALLNINGGNAVQGVSGQVSLGQDGNPVDKEVVILYVDAQGFIHMENQSGIGKFLANS
ncbi:protein kinase domain-containing protein [Ktedonobacter robiniae]|uniref:non-specific serine/threonine protein kinase n=1 Tax=Ktedonobacter robiniae TaxID=2778365 RepID=A0ABQ3UNU0_9CHLR|nr:ABC transporter substrate-binding protein [Ktedonobacter robiniae]GHO54040.1 hypothetical protein KSB_25150 [Ktedonobacter robiniae]